MKFIDLLDTEHFMVAIKFQTYWSTNGMFRWEHKANGWITWLHEMWVNGYIHTTDYRYLVNVDVEDI
jgi:hypothetical protein